MLSSPNRVLGRCQSTRNEVGWVFSSWKLGGSVLVGPHYPSSSGRPTMYREFFIMLTLAIISLGIITYVNKPLPRLTDEYRPRRTLWREQHKDYFVRKHVLKPPPRTDWSSFDQPFPPLEEPVTTEIQIEQTVPLPPTRPEIPYEPPAVLPKRAVLPPVRPSRPYSASN
jgi:hypothetical protein